MKWKLLTAAALLACGTGIAKADSLSISIGAPPAYVYYDNYAPRPVYREVHRHYHPAPRVVYHQPRVVYRDVHYYDHRDRRGHDHRGRGHDHHHHHHGRH